MAEGGFREFGLASPFGPCTFVGTLVRRFGSMVEAESLLAGLAKEWKEVELVAVVVLAMFTYERGVESILGIGHLDIARLGVLVGRHVGHSAFERSGGLRVESRSNR